MKWEVKTKPLGSHANFYLTIRLCAGTVFRFAFFLLSRLNVLSFHSLSEVLMLGKWWGNEEAGKVEYSFVLYLHAVMKRCYLLSLAQQANWSQLASLGLPLVSPKKLLS